MNDFSPKSRIRRKNRLCAYCHQPFASRGGREEEHVIGKKFVPKGSLASQWNLIVYACGKCNDEKCELENDISAILMQPDRLERFNVDERLRQEARRKGSTQSKRTGKAVSESDETLKLHSVLRPGITVTADLSSGPQVDPERIDRLAFFHIAGFFYLITYNEQDQVGSPIPSTFCPVASVSRSDWGNSLIVGFERLTAEWPGRFYGVGADTFFKAVIRRSPVDEPPLWSWALEWNHTMRVIGFFGDGEAAQAAFDKLPFPEMHVVEAGVDPERGRFVTRIRAEVPIDPAVDHLFACPSNIVCSKS